MKGGRKPNIPERMKESSEMGGNIDRGCLTLKRGQKKRGEMGRGNLSFLRKEYAGENKR